MGRKLFDGKDYHSVVQKLEQAWALDCSDAEAASLADISPQVLVAFLKNNQKIAERKAKLKEQPVLNARNTLHKAINKGDGKLALQYLERKRKKEFSTLTEIKDNTPPSHDLSDVSTEVLKQLRDLWNSAKNK